MSSEVKSWPNLVGQDGQEAAEAIKAETGFTNVVVLPEKSPVTMDLRTDRVRIFVNEQGKVVHAPYVA